MQRIFGQLSFPCFFGKLLGEFSASILQVAFPVALPVFGGPSKPGCLRWIIADLRTLIAYSRIFRNEEYGGSLVRPLESFRLRALRWAGAPS